MALTWRNVTGVSSNAGTQAVANAGDLFNKAFSKAEKIASAHDTEVQQRTDASLRDQLSGLTSEDQLDTFRQDLLSQGTDQYSPGLLDKLVDAQRQDIRTEDEFQRTTLRRESKENSLRLAKETASIDPELAGNLKAHQGAIEHIETLDPTNRGLFTLNKLGKVVVDKKADPSLVNTFIDKANELGRVEIPTVKDRTKELAERLSGPAFSVEDQENARKFMLEIANRKDLPETARASITANTEQQLAFQKDDINRINSLEADLLAAVDNPQNPRDKGKENLDAINYLQQNFNEGHLNLFGYGNVEGGKELTQKAGGWLTQGITRDDVTHQISPTMLYNTIGIAADFEQDMFDAAGVDIEKMEDALVAEAKKSPVSTPAQQRAAIRLRIGEERRISRLTTQQGINNFIREVDAQNGIINPKQNAFLYSPELQRTFKAHDRDKAATFAKEEEAKQKAFDRTVQQNTQDISGLGTAAPGTTPFGPGGSGTPSAVADDLKASLAAPTVTPRIKVVPAKPGVTAPTAIVKQKEDAVEKQFTPNADDTRLEAWNKRNNKAKAMLELRDDPEYAEAQNKLALQKAQEEAEAGRTQDLLRRSISDERLRNSPAVKKILREQRERGKEEAAERRRKVKEFFGFGDS